MTLKLHHIISFVFLFGVSSILGQYKTSILAPDFPDLSATLKNNPSEVIETVESQLRFYGDDLPSAKRIQLYLLLGKAYQLRDSLRNSMFAFQKGLSDASTLNLYPARVRFLIEIGKVYSQLGESLESEKVLNEALDSAKSNNLNELLGEIYDGLGRSSMDRGLFDASESALKQAIIVKRDYNESLGTGHTFNLLAELNIKKANYAKALEYIDLAVDGNREEGKFQEVANSYLLRSTIYRVQNNPSLVLLNARAAVEMAQQNGLADVERKAYNEISHAYSELGEFKQAYDFLEKYNNLQSRYLENLRGEEFARARTSLLSEVDQQQKQISEKEILLKNAKLAEQEALLSQSEVETYSLIIGIVCLLVLLCILFIQSKVRRKTDTELLNINSDLKIALENAKTLQLTAEDANEAKSQFLANMSHEIRTPLNAVIGMSTILHDTELSSEQEKYLKSIQSSSNGLLSLLNDLLDFSKIESGMVDIESIPFDLETIVEEVFDMMQPSVETKGIKFLLEFEDALPQAFVGDPSRIRQILINIIGNAIKFTHHGHVKLTLSVKTKILEGVVVQFLVEDTGIGISNERMDSLFDPFNQADNSHTRKYGGSGLGLSICKRLTELMHGEIWVESEISKGTRFYFTIPLKLDNSADHLNELTQLARGKHLLVVDDNDTNRRILKIYGERIGMIVEEADNAYGVLNILQGSLHYDMAIIDYQMPGMDGLELTKRIREMDEGRISLIMLSSSGDKRTRDKALEIGVNEYLNKPVKREVLFSAISKALVARQNGEVPKKVKETPAKVKLSSLWEGSKDIKILLAEDNPMNQRVATILLNRMGLSCKVVDDGLAAVNATKEESFDLILMDLQMPVMDGLEATRQIRAENNGEKKPVIVAMTAAAAKEDEIHAFRAGMDAFLTKPVRAADLAAVLQEKLKQNK